MCARLIFATLIGLMLCSIATIETTELPRLADDTSNDFSLPNVPRQAASIAVAEFREPYPHTAPTLKGQGVRISARRQRLLRPKPRRIFSAHFASSEPRRSASARPSFF